MTDEFKPTVAEPEVKADAKAEEPKPKIVSLLVIKLDDKGGIEVKPQGLNGMELKGLVATVAKGLGL